MGTMIELSAGDGFRLAAYRAEPEGPPRGGLVVVQEIFGVNSHIRSVCDGYAADGYRAGAPARVDRLEKGGDRGYSAPDSARGREFKAKASSDAALLDVDAARAAVAASGKVGIVGYCWGGLITWLAACRLKGFACASSYYGGGILDAAAEQPRCPVIAHFGERDHVIPVAGVRAFAQAHADVAVHIYAADHGFNCDQRGSYDPAAATLARQRTLDFLRQHVG
jgi:carboxymethylenebutenolidase